MDLDVTPMWDALRQNPLAGPLVVDPIETINEQGGFYEPDRPPRDWLVPTPVPGIYISPNEAVDPRDCEKWPNSPYCKPGETFDLGDVKTPMTYDLKPTASRCEVCIEAYPRLFGVAMVPTIVCSRNDTPECQVKPSPLRPPATTGDLEDPGHTPKAPDNFIRLVAAFSYVEIRHGYVIEADSDYGDCRPGEGSGRFAEQFPAKPTEYLIVPGVILSSGYKGAFDSEPQTLREKIFAFKDSPYNAYRIPDGTIVRYGKYGFMSYEKLDESGTKTTSINGCEGSSVKYRSQTAYYVQPWAIWRDYPCSMDASLSVLKNSFMGYLETNFGYDYFEGRFRGNALESFIGSTPFAFYDWAIGKNCENKKPKPVPQPIPEKDMGCCEESLEILEAIYSRLGVDEFPVKAPPLLIDEGDKEIEMDNHAQLWEWTARNLDAVMGQFPIKIKIKDSDPTTEGNQEIELNFPNVAETLAELFGLVYQSEINTDLISEILLRLIPEVLATKNATITTQSYAKANASYLGYEGNTQEVEVDFNFDLENPQSLPQFLKETKKRVRVYRDESKESVAEVLSKLEFAAGIIKASLYTTPSQKNRLLSSIESIIEDEAMAIPNKEQWRDWLQRMNRDAGKHNAGQVIQPEIIEEYHEGIGKLGNPQEDGQ